MLLRLDEIENQNHFIYKGKTEKKVRNWRMLFYISFTIIVWCFTKGYLPVGWKVTYWSDPTHILCYFLIQILNNDIMKGFNIKLLVFYRWQGNDISKHQLIPENF